MAAKQRKRRAGATASAGRRSARSGPRDAGARCSNGQPEPAGVAANLVTADGPYPYRDKLKRKDYEKTLRALQIELLKVQSWVKREGKRIVVLFEGRDAAGKGGTIKRFTEHLNPRGARVVALDKPDDTEQGQWYFQRYIAKLPSAGEIVFFDRSWYNRAGVEPVMGFCTPEDYIRFRRQVAGVERGLIDGGITLIKLWFDVGRDQQRRRIEARRSDPLKHWKLSSMDFESIKRWDDYTKARDSMFFFSHTREAPWMVIRSDDKRRARIAAILTVLNLLPYPDKSPAVVTAPDRQLVGPASEMFPIEGRLIFDVVRA
jgi:polyphosphate kinase 2